MVVTLIFFFFTVWKVADNLLGLVKEPMEEERMLIRSLNSATFLMLWRPTISVIYVSSKRDFKNVIF